MYRRLQSIDEDLALAPMLSGVDVMIAGGGDELLADPADLIAAADTDFSTCRAEAEDLLGKAWDPAGAALPWEPGEVVVWFVLGDGATVQSLAVFDPAGCVLLASRP